ncbi:WD40-repeat-containing domain protein [Lactarius deliciosus]|nr:WD40-repeat-containing domain protein [Lactarius deliciosus]
MSRTILNEPTSPRFPFVLGIHSDSIDVASSDIIEALASPEDGIKKSVIIDMKDVVGDAVGNMSIGPSYRDLVLAARNGLFIIDLNAPSDVPRFLSQGGTWDVADVQWNPHPARAEYIISTSSEKLLIWNLCLTGKSAIQHVLHSHYRAITDINWHTLDPDIVVSTGIDSWLWAWDLRTPQKPIMAGGTQVKWNRLDGNILASSHLNEVLIWDRRKGSMPVKNIKAHSAKIYGIDWAHNSSRELLTCSLDKTIKLWDVDSSPTGLEGTRRSEDIARTLPGGSICEPFRTIHTSYPVWRARDLPFGDGLLSLPQRGGEAPELWTHNTEMPHASIPVEAFEGHTDVVKEFVWRRGGRDWGDFQLITWSKDKTLRFWPIDQDVLERAGQPPDKDMPPRSQGYGDNRFSFRTPPETSHTKPTLSAPVGQRGILAEVRAMHFAGRLPNPVLLPPRGARDASQPINQLPESEPEQTPTVTAISVPPRQGGTMTRGNRSARMDALTWLSSFRVGERARDGSSGTGSGAESGSASRIGSRSRPPSRDANSATLPVVFRKRSDSHGRWDDESEGQSLQDEITSVVTRLQQESSRIKLEKHDLEKKRTCTLGLNGPWGESSSVFVRVTFAFPKDYPHSLHPGGTPTVDLERSPLISIRNRAFMLRRLRMLRETRHDETTSLLRSKRAAIIAPLHSDKNIAEPVTSQGVFGPNGKGQLVCFSRAPPRIVPADSIPRLFQSPALISDAVRRLARASHDSRVSGSDAQRRENGDNILHIMTNLLLFSRLKQRRPSEQSRQLDDIPANYSLLPTHAMTVFVRDEASVTDLGQELAAEYVFDGATPSEVCNKNADVARKYNRRDREDFFVSLGLLLSSYNELSPKAWGANALACSFIKQMYGKFAQEKSIQMLAMLAIMLLKMHVPIAPLMGISHLVRGKRVASHGPQPGYTQHPRLPPISPRFPSRPCPPAVHGLVLFGTSNMRQLIGSNADMAKDNGHAELQLPTHEEDPAGIPVPGNRRRKFSDVDSPRTRHAKSDSPQRRSPALRLPDVGAARIPGLASPLAAQGPRPTFSQGR